jgi:hypothetical protein
MTFYFTAAENYFKTLINFLSFLKADISNIKAMKNLDINPAAIPVGIVGLGLMGCSITTCILMAGHPVVAIAPIPQDLQTAQPRIREHLEKAYHEALLSQEPDSYFLNLTITQDYGLLKDCKLVIECTIEDLEIKKSVYAKIEAAVSEETIITSNTSAIPISILQRTDALAWPLFRTALDGAITYNPLLRNYMWRLNSYAKSRMDL